MVQSSVVLLLEEEEDTSSLTETIQEFKREINSFVNPLPVPFIVVQGGVGGEIGLVLEALSKYVEGQFKEMQNRTLRLVEKINAKFAALAAQAPDSKSKAKRKVGKLQCTADDDQAYTYIKVCTFVSLNHIANTPCRVWHML